MRWLLLIVLLLVLLARSGGVEADSSTGQFKPESYGVYAVQGDHLVRLEGRPASELVGPLGMNGIIQNQSAQVLIGGHLSFLIFRRELAVTAPDEVFVHIVARVAREKTIGPNGQVSGSKPLADTWYMRDRGFNFRVGPYADNREMVIARSEQPDFELPSGRYAILVGSQYFDFLIKGENRDTDHCVEWVPSGWGVSFPPCPSPLPTSPKAASVRCDLESATRSVSGSDATQLTFFNGRVDPIKIYWLDYKGARKKYAELPPGETYVQSTYLTHPWLVADRGERCLYIFLPSSEQARIEIR